jgi:hypothetical protein
MKNTDSHQMPFLADFLFISFFLSTFGLQIAELEYRINLFPLLKNALQNLTPSQTALDPVVARILLSVDYII